MSAAPAPMATPVVSAPRSTLRMHSRDTGPGWAPTNRPSPKPTRSELTERRLRARSAPAELALERGQPVVPRPPTSAIQASASDIGAGVGR